MHVSSDYFPKKKRKEKKGNLPPPQKTLSVFTLSRATEIKAVLFCKCCFGQQMERAKVSVIWS